MTTARPGRAPRVSCSMRAGMAATPRRWPIGDSGRAEIRERPRYYILDGRTPVPADRATWAAWIEDPRGRVMALDRFEYDSARVSTVFTGEDDQVGGGHPPLLFESTIFWPDGDLDEWVER